MHKSKSAAAFDKDDTESNRKLVSELDKKLELWQQKMDQLEAKKSNKILLPKLNTNPKATDKSNKYLIPNSSQKEDPNFTKNLSTKEPTNSPSQPILKLALSNSVPTPTESAFQSPSANPESKMRPKFALNLKDVIREQPDLEEDDKSAHREAIDGEGKKEEQRGRNEGKWREAEDEKIQLDDINLKMTKNLGFEKAETNKNINFSQLKLK